MVDTFRSCNRLLLRLWALWATRLRVVHKPTGLTGRIRWAPAETAAFAVDEAKLKIGETHLPLAAVGLGKTDRLTDQDLADEDEFAAPLDLAVAAHAAHRERVGIDHFAHRTWIGPRRWDVVGSRCLESERLVRPLFVEVAAERVKARLLLGDRRGRRGCGFGLERAVHTLMTPVLLRLSRINPLRNNAKLEPPNRQWRKAGGSSRGKGRAIVRADLQRQTDLAEVLLEHRPDMLMVGTFDRLAAQQTAAEAIAQRQRITAALVASAEPTLEIGAPDIVGRLHGGKRLPERRGLPTPTPRLDQSLPLEPFPDCARCRQVGVRVQLAQLHPQLARPPMRVPLAQRKRGFDQVPRPFPAMRMRCPVTVLQSCRPFLAVTLKPDIARRPADPRLPAQFAHRPLAFQSRNNKAHSFVHDAGLSPRHRQVLPAVHRNLPTMYPVYPVRDPIGLLCQGSNRSVPASGALATRSKSGEGACPQPQTRGYAPSTGFLRCARNPTSPRTRGEVAQVALPRTSRCQLKCDCPAARGERCSKWHGRVSQPCCAYGSPGANGGCLPAGTPSRAMARIMATVT